MNHDKIREVIFDNRTFIQSEQIVYRDCQFDDKVNYVLVGLRRAGKSTLLYERVQELVKNGVSWNQIVYINFEDERLTEFALSDCNDIVQVASELTDEKPYYFFDEIQNIDGWEKFARRMADAKERVCITGSNARMLSREIETTLGARYMAKKIYPYSFAEFLRAKDIPCDKNALSATKSRGKIAAACDEYLAHGGFPELFLHTDKRGYLTGVYQKILLGDVALRNGIRNDKALRLLVKKIAESVCSEISYSKLHGILKAIGVTLGKDTLIDYIDYVKDAYLLFTIKNYVAAFAEKESNPKYYFNDNGILNLFLMKGDTAGLENVVAVTLSKRYGEELYYFKSAKSGIDVDFYVPQTQSAYQVAYSIEGTARAREVANLEKMAKHFPEAKQFFIVTKEEKEVIQTNKAEIHVVPMYEFLLEEGNYSAPTLE